MTITAINPFKNMTYAFHIKPGKSILEVILRRKLDENPKLINATDRIPFHPLFREYSHKPFPRLQT